MSEGVAPTVNITESPFFFVQGSGTAIAGQQSQDETRYSFGHPKDAIAAELSKIEQIVEYLKVLYR